MSQLLVRDSMRETRISVDAVDTPPASVQPPLQHLADLEPYSAVDLRVPVGSCAVVELDVPVAWLNHLPRLRDGADDDTARLADDRVNVAVAQRRNNELVDVSAVGDLRATISVGAFPCDWHAGESTP